MTDVPAYQGAVPGMPEIEPQEEWEGSPFLLADLSVAIGWQWLPAEQGGPRFVVARRTRMGTLRVTDQYPLSAGGWAAAWQALAASSPESARRTRAALESRAAARQERALRAAAPSPLDWRAAARLMDITQLRDPRVVSTLDSGPVLRAIVVTIPVGLTVLFGVALLGALSGAPDVGHDGITFLVLFAFSLVASVLTGIRGARHATVVSPAGITWRGRLLWRHRYRWDEITAVRVNTGADADTFFGDRSLSWGRNQWPSCRVQLTLASGRRVQPISPAAFGDLNKAFWEAASVILAYWNTYHAAP